MVFYVITNFLMVGTIPWQMLSHSTAPLALAGFTIMGVSGALLLSVGALFSISGSDEAGVLTAARIPYAMAGDALLPHAFAKIHPQIWYALRFPNCAEFCNADCSHLRHQLIILSVFTILFCYLVTCFAVSSPLKKELEEE